jgi:predicted nucleic acid-binding protein
VRFWDSSAIVPLLFAEQESEGLAALFERDPQMLVWWASPVECISALARRERERELTAAAISDAMKRLRALADAWQEVLPGDTVRTTAQRLLRVHPLRAADALQLGAAIVASEHDPGSLPFVTCDERLDEAAGREGFPIVRA